MAAEATARAPGRVNLIGEHTDYNGGLCLPVALPCETTAHAARRDDGLVRLSSAQQDDVWEGELDDAAPGRVSGWAAYAAGALWALDQAGFALPGLEVAVDSTVPLGAGLSSSASLEAAVALAACGLLDLRVDDDLRQHLVEVCRRAETEVVGAPTGGLDQAAVLHAPAGGALLLDFASGERTLVDLPLAEAGLTIVVVDTRVSHAHSEGGYGSRREECTLAARQLGVSTLRDADPTAIEGLDDDLLRRRARHVVTENERVLTTVAAVRAGEWRRVGELFCASHDSMRDDFEISCPELDLATEAALEAGALGARMTGGGFGGSAIALVPTVRTDACRRAVDVAFARAGFAPPAHLDGTPSAPASLV